MDIRRQLRQGASCLFRQRCCSAHTRQLTSQQDQHDPQVTNDRQQQASQALGPSLAAALVVDRPDLLRFSLSLQQHAHRSAGRQRGRRPMVLRTGERDRRHHGVGIRAKAIKQAQCQSQLAVAVRWLDLQESPASQRGRQLTGLAASLPQPVCNRCDFRSAHVAQWTPKRNAGASSGVSYRQYPEDYWGGEAMVISKG
jgi:hypothetical protein